MNSSAPRSKRKLRLLVGALVVFAAVLGQRYYADWQRAAELRAEVVADEQARARFQKIVSLNPLDNPPLSGWLAEFTRQTGIKVEIEQPTPPLQVALETPISLPLPPLPAHEWLRIVAELHDSTCQLRSDGTAVFNPNLESEQRYWLNYPLPEQPQFSPGDLEEWLTNLVTPYEWYEWGSYSSHYTSPTGVTTLQPHRGHLQTQKFLAKLAEAYRQTQHLSPGLAAGGDALQPAIWIDGEERDLQVLQTAFSRPITLRAVDMPFADFAAALSKQANFPIIIHPRLLQTAAKHIEVINCDYEQVPFRHALNQFFQTWEPALQMDCRPVAGGRLLVICADDAETLIPPGILFAYPVRDLVGSDSKESAEELEELLMQVIEPDRWDQVGGEGVIEALPQGLLLISQRLDVHRQIRELLTRLREVRSGACRHTVLLAEPPLPTISAEVQKRLAEPATFQFRGVVEQEAFAQIFESRGIRLPGLEEEGISRDSKIWCYLPKRPLHENLEILLAGTGYELRFLEQVTTADDEEPPYADESLIATEVFDLRPWMTTHRTLLTVPSLLECVVERDHWDTIGGPGSCDAWNDLLVVRAHPRVLGRIRSFVATLEKYVGGGKREWRVQSLAGDLWSQPLDLCGPDDPDFRRQQRFQASHEEILRKLKQPVTVKIQDKEIGAALVDLAREYELPLIFTSVNAPSPLESDPFGALETKRAVYVAQRGAATVTIDAENQPLGEILQQISGDPTYRVWRVANGHLTLGSPDIDYEERPPFFLFSVDDLLTPRGALRPKQLIRTVEKALSGAAPRGADGKPKEFTCDFHFGNLLQVYNDYDEVTREQIEKILRQLRSGELQPLPAEKGDGNYYEPYFPPGYWQPSTWGVVPVIGNLDAREERR